MPLFEIETDSHIIITWANDESAAREVVSEAYPSDELMRLTRRPRDTWVISKGALGLTDESLDPCTVARDCLSRSAGDKVNAIRLYRMETGQRLGTRPQGDRVQHGDRLVRSAVVDYLLCSHHQNLPRQS